MFCPITERSPRIRTLYAGLYLALLLGALTMILPFLVMLSGSFEPYPRQGINLFPSYMVSDEEMWQRWVTVKYGGNVDALRAAWNMPGLEFAELPRTGSTHASDLEAWNRFLEETDPPSRYFSLAFVQNPRMASYSVRLFRVWLLARYDGSLDRLNKALGTDFSRTTMIRPPVVSITGLALNKGPLWSAYEEFLAEHPSLCVPVNAGGYYRTVFLPGRYGDRIEKYNARHGTEFSSWAQIPFPAEAPPDDGDWFYFVSQILKPDFVVLTESGEQARAASGMNRNEFIRTAATPLHLRVDTLDVLFAEWMGRTESRPRAILPQEEVDAAQMQAGKNVWRWRFAVLNYQRVLDEMMLHGRAGVNTLILVGLYLIGALTVNPLAAYALSRYKPKGTYFILTFCLASIAFPAEVLMIPVFLQLKEWSLLNTFGALVIPNLANGFSIFLLKGFFDSLPRELYEAAEIDGASGWVIFWNITMTLSRPILAVIALGAFTTAYGMFFYALILAPDSRLWTMMVYIFQLQSSAAYPVVYASLILVSIPTLLVFVFCQRIILRGIVVPSEK